MTDRELLADLLDNSVTKARKKLKETGQIENNDVIPLVLHDYHGRFDSIDEHFDKMDENFGLFVTEVQEGFKVLLTKEEFNTHTKALGQTMGALNTKMDTLDKGLNYRMDILEKGLTHSLRSTQWLIGLLVFIFLALMGTVITYGQILISTLSLLTK
jgi:hypothetical protein